MLQPASIKDRMATLRRHTSSSSDGGGSALPRTTILHLNVRPIEGVKWSTIQVQKSTIYLQSTKAMDHIKALQQIYAYVEAGDVGNAVMGCLRVAKSTPQSKRRAR